MKSNNTNQPIPTLIWGFTDNFQNIIWELAQKGLIAPKCWFYASHSGHFTFPQLNMVSFWHPRWLTQYKTLIENYEKGVPHNEDIYQFIYQNYLWKFIDQFSRTDAILQHKPLHSYLQQFNLFYKFIYSILIKEKIQFCLFSQLPHEGIELIIYAIAKTLGIKTLLFFQSSIPNAYHKCFYLEDVSDIGKFSLMTDSFPSEPYQIQRKTSNDYWYMQHTTPKKFVWQQIGSDLSKLFSAIFDSSSAISPITLKTPLEYGHSILRNKEYIRRLQKHVKSVDYTKKYVYFPLHLQPELTTSCLGGKYCDQILALERLQDLLPPDWYIYVKENPKQTDWMRDEYFFKRLELIANKGPKIILVPRAESSLELILHSQFVSTITGTAGWESLCEMKPVLIFGNIWYKHFTGVFSYDAKDTQLFDKIMHCKISLPQLEQEINRLLRVMPNCITDGDYIPIINQFNQNKNNEILKQIIAKYVKNHFGAGSNSFNKSVNKRIKLI